MLLTKYIKRFDKGGLIDTEAMLEDTKKDPRFFAKGAYTKSGKERLAAIQEIKDTQSKGYQYKFDDSGETFKIVNDKGDLATTETGHGVESTKKITPFYGLINNEKRSKKEVSKLLSNVATGSYLKTSIPEKLASRDKVKEEQKVNSENNISTKVNETPTNTTESKAESAIKGDRGEGSLKNQKSVIPTINKKSPVETRVSKDKASTEVNNNKSVLPKSVVSDAKNSEKEYLKKLYSDKSADVTNNKSVVNTTSNEKVNTNEPGTNVFLEKKFDDEINNIESLLKFDIYNSKPVSTYNGNVGDLLKRIDNIDNEFKTKTVLNTQDPNLNKLANEKGVIINAINKYSKQILFEKIKNVSAAIEKNKISLTYNKNIPQDLKLKQLSKLDALHNKYDKMFRSIMNNSSTDFETIKNNLSLLQPATVSHKQGGVMKFQFGDGLDALFNFVNSNEFKNTNKSSYYNTNSGNKFNERTLASSEKKSSKKLVKEKVDWNKDGKIDELDDKAAPTLKNKTTSLIKRTGPIITTTGVSTPLGTLQYNDIAQFLLLRKAHKKPVAEVPVNYERFREHGVKNVQAARDLDASMIQTAKSNIANLNSSYNGSDPIMEAAFKNAVNEQKTKLTNELIDKRSAYRRSEEDRVNAELEQRREQAADDLLRENDVYNRNKDREFEAKIKKAEAETNKESAYWQGIGQLSANIQSRINNDAETRKQLAYEIDARDYNSKESKLLSDLKSYNSARTSAEIISKQTNKPFDPSEYDKKIEEVSKQLEEHRKNRNVLSDYDKISKGKPLLKK